MVPDAQAAHEFTMSALLVSLAGSNMMLGVGYMESGITFNYANYVMNAMFYKNIRRISEGLEVSEETKALDAIKEVGPASEFLSHPHTFEHCRTEMINLPLMERRIYDYWDADGRKDLAQRANEEAIHILETHHPEPLPQSVASEIRSIVNEAEEHYGLPLSNE